MSAIFRPEAPMQVDSATPREVNKRDGETMTIIDIVGTVVNRQGYTSKLAVQVINPKVKIGHLVEPGSYVTFEGRFQSRESTQTPGVWFQDVVVFAPSILKVEGYTPPADQPAPSQAVTAGSF